MSEDILTRIVEMRRDDLKRMGPSFGVDIPKTRRRPHVKFLERPGAIFEVKRASPSKGDIALNLVPKTLAKTYAEAGAQAISVLTEKNFFKGSLTDLIEVSENVLECAILRKDFILEEEELDIAWNCGADAVLLIARILDDEKLLRLTAHAKEIGLDAFVEVRERDDLRKLHLISKQFDVVAGVNSRNLSTFQIDALVPAALRTMLPGKAVFESGVHTLGDAAFARNLGFDGILVGEAVAKNPSLASPLANAFEKESPNLRGAFWKTIAERIAKKREEKKLPFVKICGITNPEDAALAKNLGADALGFVFAESKRKVSAEMVKKIVTALETSSDSSKEKPFFIGVVTDPKSPEGREALELICEGILDAIQLHDCERPIFMEPKFAREKFLGKMSENVSVENETEIQKDFSTYSDLASFFAVRIGDANDLEKCREKIRGGEPRLLLDSYSVHAKGGSGVRIPSELLPSKEFPLWLAGGITPENVKEILDTLHPELIDISSGVEESPGKKDIQKLTRLFKEINS